jgi:hypothetical protein
LAQLYAEKADMGETRSASRFNNVPLSSLGEYSHPETPLINPVANSINKTRCMQAIIDPVISLRVTEELIDCWSSSGKDVPTVWLMQAKNVWLM